MKVKLLHENGACLGIKATSSCLIYLGKVKSTISTLQVTIKPETDLSHSTLTIVSEIRGVGCHKFANLSYRLKYINIKIHVNNNASLDYISNLLTNTAVYLVLSSLLIYGHCLEFL